MNLFVYCAAHAQGRRHNPILGNGNCTGNEAIYVSAGKIRETFTDPQTYHRPAFVAAFPWTGVPLRVEVNRLRACVRRISATSGEGRDRRQNNNSYSRPRRRQQKEMSGR